MTRGSKLYKAQDNNSFMRIRGFLFCVAVIAVFITAVPAAAYKQDFQNFEAGDLSIAAYGDDPLAVQYISINHYPYSETLKLNITAAAPTIGKHIYYFVYYPVQQAATNFTVTTQYLSASGSVGMIARFCDASMTTLLDYSMGITDGRYDFTVTPDGHILVYRNGVYTADAGVVGVNPSYFLVGIYESGGTGHMLIDDYAISPAAGATDVAARNFMEAIPSDYYIVKDAINPANNGLYNSSGAVNSNYYWVNFTTTGNATKTIEASDFTTGTVLERLYTSGIFGGVRFNISSLSTSYSGLHRMYLDETGSSSTFWVTGYGATITWDKETYATDESAVVSWSILPAYYDTTSYNYEGRIINAYGTTMKTWSITSASGSETTVLDSTTYPQGTYFATIVKTLKAAPYTETTMYYDYAEIVTDVIVTGSIYDYAGLGLPGAVVNLTQSGTTTQHTATPAYNQSGLDPGIAINLTANKTYGYLHVPVEFTPPSWGTYTVNLYLSQDLGNISHSGNNSIFGFVQEDALFQPVGAATVHISNATFLHNTTANATGFYQFDQLAEDQIYTLWATATGYNQSANYNTNTTTIEGPTIYNATRQDIFMEAQYALQVDVRSSDTLAYIVTPVEIAVSTGTTTQSASVSSGTANFTVGYGLYQISASSDGYTSDTTTVVISGDRVVTLYLTVTNPYSVQLQPDPKYLTIRVFEGFGTPVPGVGITMQGVTTSTGSWDWIATLAGIPLDEVPINMSAMYQTTDDSGRAVFYVIPTAKYNVSFVKTGYTIPSVVRAFSEDIYDVQATNLTTPHSDSFMENGTSQLSQVKVTVTTGAYNESVGWLNITYLDANSHTIGGTINVTQKSQTPFGAATTLASYTVTTSSMTQSLQVWHIQQESGQVFVNVTHSDFGQIRRSYTWSFNSIPVDFLGFDANIKMLVAFAIMMLTAMLGGAASARAVSVAVCIEGWLFQAMHFFQAMEDRGIAGEAAVWTALVLMTAIAIAANIEVRKKKERY